MSRVFYRASRQFKLISFMYSILSFCILTGFLCRFKTSKVVVEKPFYPQTYQQSLDYKPSLAFFYDKFSLVSDQFRDAPRNSIKGKMWTKLMASGRLKEFNTDDDRLQIESIVKVGQEMKANKSICIGASFTLPFVRSFACVFKPNDQLYFLKILSDPIEPEFIYGFALSNEFRYKQQYIRKQRHALESDFLSHYFKTCSDPVKLLGPENVPSNRQMMACTSDESFEPEVLVISISLNYFKSFFQAALVVWFVAFTINVIQIAGSKRYFIF